MKTMKKTIIGILAGVMVLSIGMASVSAAGRGRGRNYTDTNGDGICDYAASHCAYTDADNDGVCDNRAEIRSARQGHGCRNGRGR